MNVRLSNQTIRVRISADELAAVSEGRVLEGRTCFGTTEVFATAIRFDDAVPEAMAVTPMVGRLELAVSRRGLEALSAGSRDGISAVVGNGDGALEIGLEVDLFTAGKRRKM